jgi:hypothetical protein
VSNTGAGLRTNALLRPFTCALATRSGRDARNRKRLLVLGESS